MNNPVPILVVSLLIIIIFLLAYSAFSSYDAWLTIQQLRKDNIILQRQNIELNITNYAKDTHIAILDSLAKRYSNYSMLLNSELLECMDL